MNDFNTAQELIEYLRHSNLHWKVGERFIFRAQYEKENFKYQLLPTIFRPDEYRSILQNYLKKTNIWLSEKESKTIVYDSLKEYPKLYDTMILKTAEQLILSDFVNSESLRVIHSRCRKNFELDTYQG